MPAEVGDQIPPIGTYADEENFDRIEVPAKLFSPYHGWTWYIYEWDSETGQCFGLVEGIATEFGPFSLTELSEMMLKERMLPAIERDLNWQPTILETVMDMCGMGDS